MRKGIKFKDGGADLSKFGHPTVIPLDLGFNDATSYFLTSTSQIDIYPQREEEYFMAKEVRGGLRKPSLINLKFIYKAPHGFLPPGIGCLDPAQFYGMIKKFVDYQSSRPDEYYNELYPRIQRYLG